MFPFGNLGKVLVIVGIVFVVLGFLLILSDKIPWIGKLPGDIIIKRDRVTVYFPLMTSIIISLILTLLFALFRK
jgi:hypothetical protein